MRVPAAEDNVPTYQYACTACGHKFEAVQRFSDASLTDCPECAGRLRKVFSSVGIVFKGSGFYRTDSRSSDAGEGGEKSGEKSAEKSGDKPGEKSGDKPAADSSGKDAPKKDSAAKSADTGSSSGGSKAPAAAAS
jgi:putative FmdB family regulatory protein